MSSMIEICNMALGNIGVQKTIASIDEASNEAKACKRFYNQAVAEVLTEIDWPFATRCLVLALVELAPNNNWDYSYRYPDGCVKVRRVIPSDVSVSANYRDPFDIASDASGKLVLSNQVDAAADITADITDPQLFSANFVNSVSWLLGSKIAPSLSGNNATKVIDRAGERYEDSIIKASNIALNEGSPDTSPYSAFIEARS